MAKFKSSYNDNYPFHRDVLVSFSSRFNNTTRDIEPYCSLRTQMLTLVDVWNNTAHYQYSQRLKLLCNLKSCIDIWNTIIHILSQHIKLGCYVNLYCVNIVSYGVIWVKVFKDWPIKISARQPLKNLKWCGLPNHMFMCAHYGFQYSNVKS